MKSDKCKRCGNKLAIKPIQRHKTKRGKAKKLPFKDYELRCKRNCRRKSRSR